MLSLFNVHELKLSTKFLIEASSAFHTVNNFIYFSQLHATMLELANFKNLYDFDLFLVVTETDANGRVAVQ